MQILFLQIGKGLNIKCDAVVLPKSGAFRNAIVFQTRQVLRHVCTKCTLGLASVLLALSQGAPSKAQCPPQWNGVQPNPPAGTRPYAIVSGEFNGDGRTDLAVASLSNSNLRILLGAGNGTFTIEGTTYNVGGTPVAMVVGDFNHDNKEDLAVANSNSANVRILLGNGDGTFQLVSTPYSVSAGTSPSSIAIGDFNGDSRSDLVVVCTNNATVFTFKGQNDSPSTLFFNADTLTIPAPYRGPHDVAVSDFNQDGKDDLFIIRVHSGFCPNDYRVAILVGNGNGTFQPYSATTDFQMITICTTDVGAAVAVGDFNNDNFPDIAATIGSSALLRVRLSNGLGGYLAATTYSTGARPSYSSSGLLVTDIDNNGTLDILCSNYDSNNLTVLLGDGTGNFQPGGSPNVGRQASSLCAIDLDMSSGKDVVVANSTSTAGSFLNTVSVLLSATSLPVITQHPQNASVYNGYSTQVSVSATDAIAYQWQLDGINLANNGNISGATNSTLVIDPVTPSYMGKQIRCVVTNSCGFVVSNPATLSVLPSCIGDFNHDGLFDGGDVQFMVDALINGPLCPK